MLREWILTNNMVVLGSISLGVTLTIIVSDNWALLI